VLQIQATAFDDDVSATLQRMRGTKINTTVISSLTEKNNVATDMVTLQTRYLQCIIWAEYSKLQQTSKQSAPDTDRYQNTDKRFSQTTTQILTDKFVILNH